MHVFVLTRTAHITSSLNRIIAHYARIIIMWLLIVNRIHRLHHSKLQHNKNTAMSCLQAPNSIHVVIKFPCFIGNTPCVYLS